MGDHTHLDDAAAYALHAVPEDELTGLLDHFSTCAECRREVELLSAAVAVLPAAVPPVTPSSALKSRIMADVQREAALLAAAGPEADRPAVAKPARAERRARRWSWMPRPAFAGGLAVAVLAAGIAVGTQIDGSSSSPSSTQAAVRTVPAVVTGASGANLELTADHAATLDLHHLDAPPAGKVYQVWLESPSGRKMPSRTLFTVPQDGSSKVRIAESVQGVKAVLVTAEPSGGSQHPTSAPVITAKI